MDGYPLKSQAMEAIWPGLAIKGKMQAALPAKDKSDNELVRLAADGRIPAFKELVERYQKKAYFFARGMVHNSDDAYDLSQEAFIRVHKHLKNFNPAYPFKVWLFHILSNLCKNHIRQKKTRSNVLVSSENTALEASSESGNPDIAFSKSEVQAQVWQAIGELPEKFREIIIFSHFQEMSYEEMAQVLEIPRGSVMSRLYYARLKLREILEKMGADL